MQYDPTMMQSQRGPRFNQPRTPMGPANDVVSGGPGGFGPPPGMIDLLGNVGSPAPPPTGGQGGFFGGIPPGMPGGPPQPSTGFPGMPGGFGPPPMQTGFGEKPGFNPGMTPGINPNFNPNMSVREQFQGKPVMGAQGQLQNMQGDPRARNRRMGAEMLKRRQQTPKLPGQTTAPTQPGGSAPFNPMSIY